jgi:tripartite-type tricarboxylate transporter receptor subunit TctC
LAGLVASSPVGAQADYPTRPVRIVVGFAAGAVIDTPARLLAQKFSQALGQQFVVENRPGAGSNIAAEYAARAHPDGYVLFMATSANTINATITPNLGFDVTKDFAPIALVCAVPNMLVAHPSLGVERLSQLIALAKAKPEQIHFGSSGTATTTHLAGELINVMAGVKLVHVPYPGSAQALSDVLTGRIPLLFAPASAVVQHVEKGQLKAIAVTQLKRASIAPDVPTMAESGLPGYDIGLWFGLLAPAGTPREIVDKLARVSNEAIKSAEMPECLAHGRPRPARQHARRVCPLYRQRGAERRDRRPGGGIEEVTRAARRISAARPPSPSASPQPPAR